MRVLLDTHSFLWFIAGNDELSEEARAVIGDPENEVLLSVASLWEISIKSSLGKLSLAMPFEELIPDQMAQNNIELLTIEVGHLAALTTLPFHHRDPFDRMIITQAMAEDLPIIGNDPIYEQYLVEMVW